MHDTIEIRRLEPRSTPERLACLAGDAFGGRPKWRSCERLLAPVDPATAAAAAPAAGERPAPAGWPLDPRRAQAFALDRHQR